MSINMGSWDRVLRVVVGLVLIGLAATGTVGLWGWIGVGACGHGPVWLLPGPYAAGHQDLPDEKP